MVLPSSLRLSDALRGALEGHLYLKVERRGKLIEEWDDHNLIMDAARPRIRDLCSGEMTNAFISHLGVGEGQEPAAPTDTSLTNCVLVPFTTVGNPDTTTARFGFLIGPDVANGLAIREFGLFCGDGKLFAKRVRERVIEKDADMSIFGYWDIHF